MLGKPPHGFLTTPLLLPWEVNQCATVPCPGQCIAVSADAALEDCPASSAFWPVRMLGRIITEILIPLLGVRLALYLSGSIVSRLRCCPRACKDIMKQVNTVRRSCWFWVKQAGRKVGRRWLCLNWHIQRAVFSNTISLLRASPVASSSRWATAATIPQLPWWCCACTSSASDDTGRKALMPGGKSREGKWASPHSQEFESG